LFDTGEPYTEQIAVDERFAYWTSSATFATNVGAAPKTFLPADGGARMVVGPDQARSFGLALGGNQVFWTNSSLGAESIHARAKPATDGGSFDVDGLAETGSLAYAANAIFWIERGPFEKINEDPTYEYPESSVWTCSLPACPGGPRMIAEGQPGAEGIVATADAVYWINTGTKGKPGTSLPLPGAIMKIMR
jgi:hypothetical protein